MIESNNLHEFVLTAHHLSDNGDVREEFLGTFPDEWLARAVANTRPWPWGSKGFYQLEVFNQFAEFRIKVKPMNVDWA